MASSLPSLGQTNLTSRATRRYSSNHSVSAWFDTVGRVSAELRPREIPDWLLGSGRHFATTDELAELVGVDPAKLHLSLNRVRQARKIVSVTKGGWVPVAPEYRVAGAPPPLHYIDQLMGHLGHPYYVGLLSAARIHGASHQVPMVLQVVTPARLRDRTVGSNRIQFIQRTNAAERPTQPHKVSTGRVTVASVQTTILDLVEAPEHAAGLGNVATVLGDLLIDGRVDATTLAEAAVHYATTVVQRTGYLLDRMVTETATDPIAFDELEAATAGTDYIRLDPSAEPDGDRDPRWSIIVNAAVEHDL